MKQPTFTDLVKILAELLDAELKHEMTTEALALDILVCQPGLDENEVRDNAHEFVETMLDECPISWLTDNLVSARKLLYHT